MADIVTVTPEIIGVRVPDQDGRVTVFKAEMTKINGTLARIPEIEFVNPHKAPELLAVFNTAFNALGDYIANLTYHSARAEREVEKVKARLLLDVIPVLIKEKGLPSSKDVRDALIEANDEFQEAQDVCDQIAAVIQLLKGKRDGVEMAYNSVKKIIGENNYNMTNKATSRQLNGLLDETKTPGQTQDDSMFGRPDYENRRY